MNCLMKTFSGFFLVILTTFIACSNSMENELEESFVIVEEQLKYALELIEPLRGGKGQVVSPRSINKNGEIRMVKSGDWTSGFFPGELWMMYDLTKDEFWRKKAEIFTEALEKEKENGTTHDMGFKMFNSYGKGYKLTGKDSYRKILLESAKTLSNRFNSKVGCLRSWDHNSHRWDFPVIIDNMMNLELLFWASKETNDSIYYDIAVQHALTTMKNHFREDYSTYHVVDYSPLSGKVENKQTHQGYSDNSTWARGQAWALYGFTMCYRETGKKEFLQQAENIAAFIFNHPNLPDDLIPFWDFDATGIPSEPRDVSAACIIASALYELSGFVHDKAKYLHAADKICSTLTSSNYMANIGENLGFLLKHSTGSKPHNSEVDVPLVYADYYFIELMLRSNGSDI